MKCLTGPSLSTVGRRSIVGFRVRKTLLASLIKVVGLGIGVFVVGMYVQYVWSARLSAEVMPRVTSILEWLWQMPCSKQCLSILCVLWENSWLLFIIGLERESDDDLTSVKACWLIICFSRCRTFPKWVNALVVSLSQWFYWSGLCFLAIWCNLAPRFMICGVLRLMGHICIPAFHWKFPRDVGVQSWHM